MAMEETEIYYVAPKSKDVAINFDDVTAGWSVKNLEVKQENLAFRCIHLDVYIEMYTFH